MKKLFLIATLVGFSFLGIVHGADYSTTKDNIKKQCSSFQGVSYFFIGSSCSGAEKSVYYIKDLKVTKDVFDARKKEFNTNGPLCEETKELKLGDLTASCTSGQYGSYLNKGIKISYDEFEKMATVMVFDDTIKESTKKQNSVLNQKKQILKSVQSFINDLRSKEPVFFSYSIVGSKCVSSGSFLYKGNGYKDMLCENGVAKSMKYILNNREVRFSTYIYFIYNTEKKALNKGLKKTI